MLNCFTSDDQHATPICIVPKRQYGKWLSSQPDYIQSWLESTGFIAEVGAFTCLPDKKGGLSGVLCCEADNHSMWGVGHLPLTLPEGTYHIEASAKHVTRYALGWGLGAYQFSKYKQPKRSPAKLCLSKKSISMVEKTLLALYLTRDCINTPTDDMGPSELGLVVQSLAEEFDADLMQITGDELLDENYGAIYTVGRASDDAPRLLDLRWGDENNPKVTLVGKGVCFDTGGLDLKQAPYMLLMKKDMGGAANVLGLARMVMAADLPVCLRVLIPAVENAVSGNAYRPGDVITTRRGLTVEVGNTDAEGRLVVADALTEAVSEQPDLLIDMCTLTGAARVALGAELPAMFTNNNEIAATLMKIGNEVEDPVWQLPLFAAYREFLNSPIADLNNNSSEPYGGAITAALFLKEFVPDDIDWLHFDIMGWNKRALPGRPVGGEAMALRTLFEYLVERYN